MIMKHTYSVTRLFDNIRDSSTSYIRGLRHASLRSFVNLDYMIHQFG